MTRYTELAPAVDPCLLVPDVPQRGQDAVDRPVPGGEGVDRIVHHLLVHLHAEVLRVVGQASGGFSASEFQPAANPAGGKPEAGSAACTAASGSAIIIRSCRRQGTRSSATPAV